MKNPLLICVRLLLVLAVLVVISSCKEQSELPERELNNPLVFIGLDGAEWAVIKPMIERGELPNIKKLMDTGIHTGLINTGALISPPVWTTYVTGEYPRAHGILDHVFPFDGSKLTQLVNSTLRLKPALWNIASEAGLRSAVMGYYVSWPVEDILGTIVTDRTMQEHPNSVFPAATEPSVFAIVDEVTDNSFQEEFLQRYYSWGYRPEQADNPSHPNYEAAQLIVQRGDRLMVNDEIILRSTKLLQSNAYDLVVAYFRSTDLASHSFWKEYEDSGFSTPADPQLKEQLGNVIPESYRFSDEAIGELMNQFGDQANYIIVSDHGFHSAGKELILKNKRRSVITGNHRPVGIFIASGPDIRNQASLPDSYQATSMDVMPTLVRLLRLPVASEQSGKPLDWVFTSKFKRLNPLEMIKTYPIDEFARSYNSAEGVDQEKEMSALSGLGYIGGSVSEGVADEMNYDFWKAEGKRVVEHLSGEIVTELLNEKYQQAAKILLMARAKRPELEKAVRRTARNRLRRISESEYISKPVNAKKLTRKFKEALTEASVVEQK